MLRAQGLTFEEASRLSSASSPRPARRTCWRAPASGRVQSRSLPAPSPAPVPAPHLSPHRCPSLHRAEPPRPEPPMAERAPAPRPYPSFPEREQQSPEPKPDQGYASPNGWAPPPQSQPGQQQPPHAQQAPGRIAIPRANHTPAPPSSRTCTVFPASRRTARSAGPHAAAARPAMPAPDHMGPPIMRGSSHGSAAPVVRPSRGAAPSAPFPQRPPAPSMPSPSPCRLPQRPRCAAARLADRPCRSPAPQQHPRRSRQARREHSAQDAPAASPSLRKPASQSRPERPSPKASRCGAEQASIHDVVVTKAMSVRLRAPDGGFWIEPRFSRNAMDRERARPLLGRVCELALER